MWKYFEELDNSPDRPMLDIKVENEYVHVLRFRTGDPVTYAYVSEEVSHQATPLYGVSDTLLLTSYGVARAVGAKVEICDVVFELRKGKIEDLDVAVPAFSLELVQEWRTSPSILQEGTDALVETDSIVPVRFDLEGNLFFLHATMRYRLTNARSATNEQVPVLNKWYM